MLLLAHVGIKITIFAQIQLLCIRIYKGHPHDVDTSKHACNYFSKSPQTCPMSLGDLSSSKIKGLKDKIWHYQTTTIIFIALRCFYYCCVLGETSAWFLFLLSIYISGHQIMITLLYNRNKTVTYCLHIKGQCF